MSTLQDGYYFADSRLFDYGASFIVDNGSFPRDFERAPMFSAFLASVYSILGDQLIITRCLQAILGGLITVGLSLIGFRTGSYWVGVFAGVLWSIYPMGIFIAGTVYPATILALLLLLGVCSLLKAHSTRAGVAWYALAGCIFGLAALTKPVTLAAIAIVSAWILVFERQKAFSSACIFTLAALLTVTPWTIRQYDVHGKLVIIEARGLHQLAPWALNHETREEKMRRKFAAALQEKGFSDPQRKALYKKLQQEKATAATTDAEPAIDNKNAIQPPKPDIAPPQTSRENRELLNKAHKMAKRFPYEFISFFELYPRRVGFLNQQQRDKARSGKNPRLVEKIPFGNSLVNSVSAFAVSFLYIFALLGIRAMWLSPKARPYMALYLGLVLSFAATYAISWGKIRYRVPVDPYIILLSAWGLFSTWGALAGNKESSAA